jgi:hypothetical protein
MELTVEEWYAPNVDSTGTYIDHPPKTDVKCPCSTRQKTYARQQFSAHMKTKGHREWLVSLNDNKINYYLENEKLKETVRTQQMILVRLENELQAKIAQLEGKARYVETANLLD